MTTFVRETDVVQVARVSVFALLVPLSLMRPPAIGPRAAQWDPVTVATSADLRAVRFLDASRGWIVGDDVTILETTSGGVAWTDRSRTLLDSSYCCFAVRFLSPTNGWVGGTRAVLHSTNGTAFPGTQYLVETEIRKSFDAPSTSVAWAAGGEGSSDSTSTQQLYRYVQSGGSLSQKKYRFLFSGGTLNAIYFINADHGWAAGDWGDLVEITNASGASPTFSTWGTPTQESLRAIFFFDDENGWAVGESGVIVRTTTGKSWTAQSSGVTNDLKGVCFSSLTTGWVVGDAGVILSTTDAGDTWSLEPSGTFHDLHGVECGPIVMAVGDDGTVLRRSVAPPRRHSVRRPL